VRFFHWCVQPRGYSRRVSRLIGIVLVVVLVAVGCGVRNSRPFTAKASAPCFRNHGFTGVTMKPAEVGFVAAFANLGGIRARSASGNLLTVAFTASPDSVASAEAAFKSHAPKSLRPHISDIMSANRNAVLVWTTTPTGDEADAATRCLRG
jgi:hypothetical protein